MSCVIVNFLNPSLCVATALMTGLPLILHLAILHITASFKHRPELQTVETSLSTSWRRPLPGTLDIALLIERILLPPNHVATLAYDCGIELLTS